MNYSFCSCFAYFSPFAKAIVALVFYVRFFAQLLLMHSYCSAHFFFKSKHAFRNVCVLRIAIGGICTPKSSIVHHLFTDWTDLWQVGARTTTTKKNIHTKLLAFLCIYPKSTLRMTLLWRAKTQRSQINSWRDREEKTKQMIICAQLKLLKFILYIISKHTFINGDIQYRNFMRNPPTK